MIQLLRFLNQCINNSLVTSCVLSLSLAITPAALAGYQPDPKQPPPSGTTTSSGPRGGCENSQGRSLTVLAPVKQVGKTASVRPTFAWFIPDSKPFPVEFQLFELANNKNPKPVQKLEFQGSSGIMKLSLREDKPALTVGHRYFWQIAVKCDSNHPSTWLVARAEFQVVEMPADLKKALSTSKNHLEMAELYAKEGFWYDGLAEALKSAEGSRLGQVAANFLEDLAKSEAPQHSENLRQIASRER